MLGRAWDGAGRDTYAAAITIGVIDCPFVVQGLVGEQQEDIESHFLAYLHMEDFRYMTTLAVGYYLPCVLRLMMKLKALPPLRQSTQAA